MSTAALAHRNVPSADKTVLYAHKPILPAYKPKVRATKIVALTPKQQRLVEENIGLVAIHLKRFISSRHAPKRDREWDDLFQEGCLGLSRAAANFDPDSGIAFAAYAIRRIQSAVHRAFFTAFTIVNIPRSHIKKPSNKRIKISTLNRDSNDRDNAGRNRERHLLKKCHTSDTIGAHMRRVYENAVRQAVNLARRRRTRSAVRDVILKRIVEDRLLIPSEDLRTPLRVIARQTRSTFSRVLNTERRLKRRIRYILRNDPEFCVLRSLAWRRPEGYDSVLPSTWPSALLSVSGNVR